jgi:hypothetical protein
MWRGSANFSMKMRSSLKLLRASFGTRCHDLKGFLVVEPRADCRTTAASTGLDHHRIADVFGDLTALGGG